MRKVPLILWSLVIFWFSSQSAIEVTSDVNANVLAHKAAHVAVYAVLSCCAYFAFHTSKIKSHLWHLHAISYCILFAISDEIHQLAVPTRSGKISDIFVDMFGIISIYMIVRSLNIFKKTKKIN